MCIQHHAMRLPCWGHRLCVERGEEASGRVDIEFFPVFLMLSCFHPIKHLLFPADVTLTTTDTPSESSSASTSRQKGQGHAEPGLQDTIRWSTALDCGPCAPEFSKSYSDMDSKLLTLTLTFTSVEEPEAPEADQPGIGRCAGVNLSVPVSSRMHVRPKARTTRASTQNREPLAPLPAAQLAAPAVLPGCAG